MARPWTVPEHGALERLEHNLWSVAGSLPRMPLRRRMSVVRLADARLVIWSCMPLAQPAMRELEAWGTPAFVVVPGAHHRLDVGAYKARFPQAKLLCASEITPRVAEVAAVDGSLDALPADATLRCERVPGTQAGECALRVRGEHGRWSVVLNDVVFNHPHVTSLAGLVLRAIGSTGGPRITRVARTMIVSDRAALRAYLLELAELPGLARVVVSHVDVIDREPARVLRQIAQTLD
jgi:hypothetical protein